MRPRHIAASLVVAFVATACVGGAHGASGTATATVVGTVSSSGCPVAGPAAPPCPTTPATGVTISISDASGKEVVRITSDDGGGFRTQLAPGHFTAKAIDPPPPAMPGQKPVAFVAVAHRTVHVAVPIDTGIR